MLYYTDLKVKQFVLLLQGIHMRCIYQQVVVCVVPNSLLLLHRDTEDDVMNTEACMPDKIDECV